MGYVVDNLKLSCYLDLGNRTIRFQRVPMLNGMFQHLFLDGVLQYLKKYISKRSSVICGVGNLGCLDLLHVDLSLLTNTIEGLRGMVHEKGGYL